MRATASTSLDRIRSIEFVDRDIGRRGKGIPTDKGWVIQVGRCHENSHPAEILHVVYHEMGEIFFKEMDNVKWQRDWLEYIKNSPEKNETEKTGLEKGAGMEVKIRASGEHFAQCFARYCLAERRISEHSDVGEMDAFRQAYPNECGFFEYMLEE
jgi:hypothetical protein